VFTFGNVAKRILSVTVCNKVVPQLDKLDDVIELNFMKISPPRNEDQLVAPLIQGSFLSLR